MTEAEQRADLFRCEDAEVVLVACNTPARMAKGAVEALREQGVKAGLFRPLTLWPFPIRRPGAAPSDGRAYRRGRGLERPARGRAAAGGLARRASRRRRSTTSAARGGVLPQQAEIVERVLLGTAIRNHEGVAV